ncbi:hypothetical protein [Undibacterium sp.]|uniref:hypothetical protein n=1 Tax=Undibacterium sp. TaxID=1914977 RepID=UPI00375187E0
MNAKTPIDKISEVLVSASFRRITTPLEIAGIKFDIQAAFVGTGMSSDLILLVDTAFESQQRIQQKIEGVARALDLLGSKRPLTTVLAGPRPSSVVIDAMSRVCRVLPVDVPGSDDQDSNILNWLAVLLPLEVPVPSDVKESSVMSLQNQDTPDAAISSLIEATRKGANGVEQQLSILISKPLDDLAEGILK